MISFEFLSYPEKLEEQLSQLVGYQLVTYHLPVKCLSFQVLVQYLQVAQVLPGHRTALLEGFPLHPGKDLVGEFGNGEKRRGIHQNRLPSMGFRDRSRPGRSGSVPSVPARYQTQEQCNCGQDSKRDSHRWERLQSGQMPFIM